MQNKEIQAVILDFIKTLGKGTEAGICNHLPTLDQAKAKGWGRREFLANLELLIDAGKVTRSHDGKPIYYLTNAGFLSTQPHLVRLGRYLLNHWIAIGALIVAVISLVINYD